MTATCSTCAHWGGERPDDATGSVGTCRVSAPTLTRSHIAHDEAGEETFLIRGEWPWTGADDWCGQHVERAA